MKTLITRVIITFIVGVMSVVGYWMLYEEISNKSAEAAELQNKIETRVESISRIASAKSTVSGIDESENIVKSYFVSEEKIIAFINDLEVHGKTQGTNVEVLSVSTKNTETRPILVLSISIDGKFDSVLRTVGIIEYSPYHLSVSELSVRKNSKDIWRADMKILVGSTKTNKP